MKRIALLVLVSAMFTGCAQLEKSVNMALTGGVKMNAVMQECAPSPIFIQYTRCIKTTYNAKGNYPDAGEIRNFYAQMDELDEMYRNKMLTEAQARAKLYRAWYNTINYANKLEEARQASVQPYYGPETTTCSGTGSTRTCNTSGGNSMSPRTTICTGTGDIRTCTTH